ncbi:MAG: DUF302 domain-containing protein [Fibrobacter sp.]|nr:DUF302 domain-containing protein [Fibrobacter sp.]
MILKKDQRSKAIRNRKRVTMTRYGLFQEVPISFDTVLKKLPLELRRKGFEVLSNIRIDSELQKYLGVDFKRYAILGVCNLALAFKSLNRQEDSGLVVLCNLIIYEKDNVTVIGILKPTQFMSMIQNELINQDAAIIERKLSEVIDSLGKKRFQKESPCSVSFQRAVA